MPGVQLKIKKSLLGNTRSKNLAQVETFKNKFRAFGEVPLAPPFPPHSTTAPLLARQHPNSPNANAQQLCHARLSERYLPQLCQDQEPPLDDSFHQPALHNAMPIDWKKIPTSRLDSGLSTAAIR